MKVTNHKIKANGIKYNIIVTAEEIKFLDEHNDALHWVNTLQNQVLVSNMVDELETRGE